MTLASPSLVGSVIDGSSVNTDDVGNSDDHLVEHSCCSVLFVFGLGGKSGQLRAPSPFKSTCKMSTKEVTRLDVNVSQAVCHCSAHSSGVRIPRSDLSVLNFTRSLASELWLHLIVTGSKVLFDVLRCRFLGLWLSSAVWCTTYVACSSLARGRMILDMQTCVDHANHMMSLTEAQDALEGPGTAHSDDEGVPSCDSERTQNPNNRTALCRNRTLGRRRGPGLLTATEEDVRRHTCCHLTDDGVKFVPWIIRGLLVAISTVHSQKHCHHADVVFLQEHMARMKISGPLLLCFLVGISWVLSLLSGTQEVLPSPCAAGVAVDMATSSTSCLFLAETMK